MIIYKTTCLINGKIYVGQDSKNNPYYLGSGIYLNRSIKKNGRENFKKEVICECSSKKELNEKEKYWIGRLNSKYPNGYNLSNGGEGIFNPSEETRDRLRKSKLGCKSWCKGLTKESTPSLNPSKEAREKMRKSHLGQIAWNKGLTKETNSSVLRTSELNRKPRSEEARKNIKEGVNKPEFLKRLRESRRSRTDEEKRKIRKSLKKVMNTTEVREKIRNSKIESGYWKK
jgi:hypothetical protein